MTEQKTPSFNLWTEPWITLEKREGGVARLSIEQTLKHAQDYRAIYEQSPLAVVGIHRLLVAILQFAINPQENEDLRKLWRAGQFSSGMIDVFGAKYAHRFDLFSADAPFMQSADLPLEPDSKNNDISCITRLFPETPAKDYVTHYKHGDESDQFFCPSCVAYGLVSMPAFAISGGRGLKPSISGTGAPPIYVIPGGKTVFESLTASLIPPQRLPRTASKEKDDVWWLHSPIVIKERDVLDVGYLHSLTFPIRRIRLHLQQNNRVCTRCGKSTQMGVETIVFQMGEKRPEGAQAWIDPFVAYFLSKNGPKSMRPTAGKVLWRDFASLFLQSTNNSLRPEVLEQIADLDILETTYPFRCVGLRTEKNAKVCEWIDAGFDIPPSVLQDEDVGIEIRSALTFVSDVVEIAGDVFKEYIGEKSSGSPVYREIKKKTQNFLKKFPPMQIKKVERHRSVREQMEVVIWDALAYSFRDYILQMAQPENRKDAKLLWAKKVSMSAYENFTKAADSISDKGLILKQAEIAKRVCDYFITTKRKEFINE